jgi:hypothetical protein
LIPPEESGLTRDDPTAFAPPPAFGPFRVLHQIGVGALGPVFRTYEPARDRLVAVKVFRLDITPEQAQALADELARAAEADLFHPSIVEPVAAGVEGTLAYRAEEYVAAESLDIALRHEAPAPLATVVRILAQLGEAIDVARAAGVGHGALHPRDIFVTPQDARSSGFGIVDALERVGIRAPVRRPYSAPERIAGADWSTPADVFSLAAVAFELLTGRRPSGTGAQIGSLEGADVADAAAVHAVLARAMSDDAAARFPTGKELADALAAAGDVESAVTPPASRDARPIGLVAIPPATDFADEPEFADEASLPPALAAFADDGDGDTEEMAEAEAPAVEPDVEVERDEDIAHWELTKEEAAAEADAPAEPARYADIEDEIASDQLAFDAADLALNPEAEADVGPTFRSGDSHDREQPRFLGFEGELEGKDGRLAAAAPPAEARVVPIVAPPIGERQAERAAGPESLRGRPRGNPQQVIEREPDADHPDDRTGFDGTGERGRPAMLPLAVMLIIGLLLGFGAGYFVGGRNRPVQAPASASVATAPPDQQAQERVHVPDTAADARPQAVPPAPAPSTSAPPAAAPPAAGGRQNEGRGTTATTGRLVVRSSPAGAAVTINGRWSGRTPFTRDSLPFGEYTVRVVLPGYQVHRQQVSLSAASAAPVLSVRLERETPPAVTRAPSGAARAPTPAAARGAAPSGAPSGVLQVDSRPTGARVFVDDGPVGTTPVRLPDIAPGQHLVRMEMEGHQTWMQTAEVTRGRTTRVAGSLEPIR